MTRESKVGIFVVATVVLALAMSAMMGNFNLFKSDGINVIFEVKNAAGLVPKAKIKYMGIQVGQVKKITLYEDYVKIDAIIGDQYKIPDNVSIVLAQDGIMGERFIDLVLKSPEPSTGYLKEGSKYTSYAPPFSLEDLSAKIVDIANDIKKLTGALNETFATEKGISSMQEIVENIRLSSENLRDILKENKSDLHIIVENIKDFSARLDRILAKEEADVTQSLVNLRSITDNISKISSDLNEGKGTLGMLISDNETRDQLKETVAGLRDMMTKANELVLKVESGATYLTEHDKTSGFFNLKLIPSDKRYYMAGISNKPLNDIYSKTTRTKIVDATNPSNNQDYTEYEDKYTENRLVFSLQYALMFDKLVTVRGGIIENALGFGLDIYPFRDESLSLTIEASDFYREKYNTYWRTYARYNFLKYFFVTAGLDDFGSNRNSFTVGGGVQFVDDDLKYVIGSIPIGSIAK